MQSTRNEQLWRNTDEISSVIAKYIHLNQQINFNSKSYFTTLTLYPAISWVTPGNGPTVALFFFFCTIEKIKFTVVKLSAYWY